MSDEELDKIFKHASDGFTPENDTSGWKDIASKLDREAEPVWYKKKTVRTILISLFIVGTVTFWYSRNLNLISSDQSNESKEAFDHSIPQSTSVDNEKLSGSQTERLSAATNSATSDLPEKLSERNSPIFSQPVGSERISKPNTGEPVTDAESPVVDQGGENELEIINRNNQSVVQKSTAAIETDTTSFPVTEDTESELLQESSNSETPEKEEQTARRGFSIKASVGPDFSSTELSDQGAPGINFGIVTGYIFNNRWSVFTGVIASRKIYSSTNIDKPYNTSGGYAYKVDQLDGDCRILDIPVNVYYSFSQRPSLSLKAGVGFSSYIMLQEEYTYIVDKPYGSSEYYQHIEKENNEWFKMMNVSILMQNRLNNHLFLEIEPYIKIPLAGIGEGEIPLYSIGSFVSIRYDFYKK